MTTEPRPIPLANPGRARARFASLAAARTVHDLGATRPRGSIAGLVLLASIVVAFLAASSAPTPLYQHYEQVWHGTALTTTVAFGIYAMAVLVGLLSLGRLANHVGQRPVLLVALLGQMVAMALFATAGSFTPLLIGRAVQGLATGAALGLLGAALIDSDRVRGAIANAAAPGAGSGLGALVAGLVIGYLPWPTHLIYLLLIAVFAAQAAWVAKLVGSGDRRPGVLASLRPHVAVPAVARRAFATAAPVLFAVWALAGFYGSLGPTLSRQLAHSDSAALGGIGLFLLAGVASVTTVALRNLSGRALMTIGIIALVTGIAGTVAAIEAQSAGGYFAATALAGVGFGSGFQGAIRTVMAPVDGAQRAGTMSAIFVVSYVGIGAPAVLAGLAVTQGASLTHVATGYAAALIGLALLAGAGLVRAANRPARLAPTCSARLCPSGRSAA